MGRSDFDRTPIALPFDADLIPSIPDIPSEQRSRSEGGKIIRGVDVSFVDENSPDREVGKFLRFKEDSRKRGIAIDFDNTTSCLSVLAFFNRVTSAMLQKYLTDARAEGKVVKSMSLLLDVTQSREMIHDLTRWGFTRDSSKDTLLYWTWRNPLTRKPRAKRFVDVKTSEPAPTEDIQPKMTPSEYEDALKRKAELDKEIVRLQIGIS